MYRLALRIVLPFSLGYFLSYAVRNVNAVIAPDLSADLALTPSMLGLLTSAYFLAFAASQLPLGVLLDRYGARRVESLLFVVAACGCALFAIGSSITELVIARAVIGVGVSGALMGAFRAYVQWFPRERLALVNGMTMTVGGMGALAATAPVEWMLGITDWRGILWLMAGIAAAVSIAVFFVVPKHPSDDTPPSETLGAQVAGIATVFRSPHFWRVAPLAVTSQATFLAIQGLWAGPWFRDIAGFDRDQVAAHPLYITIAMVVGFLTLGVVADRLARVGVATLTIATWCCIIALGGLAVVTLDLPVPTVIPWCIFGFFGGAGFLFYAVITSFFAESLAGRAITSANVMTFAGAFAAQWGIGAVIGAWPVGADGTYDPRGYEAGFGLFWVLTALSVVWYFVSPARRMPVLAGADGGVSREAS